MTPAPILLLGVVVADLLIGCGARTPLDDELAASATAGGGSHGGGEAGGPSAGHGGQAGGGASAHGGSDNHGPCPVLPGPPLEPFPVPGGEACIDATEVTNGDYAVFLAAAPSLADQPASCSWNASFVPLFGWPPAEPPLPVVNVDWCDARAYCAWAGKHLCGRADGSPTPFTKADPVEASSWMLACSRGGAYAYPYGATYDPSRCNGKDGASQGPVIESGGPCEGGYPGIYDLSGNVWEWQDDCESDAPLAACRVRGGSFMEDSVNLTCRAEQSPPRNSAYNHFGFRCCH